MELDGLRYCTMDSGEQFVVMDGIQEMLRLHVVSLGFQVPLMLFRGVRFLLVLDESG